MPASVANAAPAEVMPFSLCTSFRAERAIAMLSNDYRNGENQRDKLAETSRRRWTLTKRLNATDLAELRTFYQARNGPHEAFYFYDVFETSPKFSYDESGVETVGRYIVRFDGPWRQSREIGRATADISLVQIT